MDDAIQNTNQNQDTPWLKYAGIFLGVLVIINIGLFGLYFFTKQRPIPVGTIDEKGFLLTKPGQSISGEKYSIKFSNPRYVKEGDQNLFKIDVEITNTGFLNPIKVITNCDISENGIIVKSGVGMGIEEGQEINGVGKNEKANWTALISLDNSNEKVSSCIYSPEGVFDPNKTIKVVF